MAACFQFVAETRMRRRSPLHSESSIAVVRW
jgi:hypothetical protein